MNHSKLLGLALLTALAACVDPGADLDKVAVDGNPAAPRTTTDAAGVVPMTDAEAQSVAAQILAANPKFTDGIDPLGLSRTKVDAKGLAHVRYQQLHGGVPVFGGEAIVHTDAAGVLFRLTDTLVRDIVVDATPAHSADAAIAVATGLGLPTDKDVEAAAAELVVVRTAGQDHLAWKVARYVESPDNTLSQPVVFVDAHDLSVVDQFENIKTTALSDSAKVTYDMNRSTRFNRAAVGDSSDSDLNTTHNAVGSALSFLSTEYGRSSYDDRGAVVDSYGHYSRNLVNAYWDGRRLIFGDGDGYNANYLGVLDVAGHELAHAITDSEAGLIYSYESGALNEASSDIFAASLEAWVDGSTSQDTWDVGEDCWLQGRALRYMQSPSSDGSSYDHYSARYTGSSDNGGVHWNSGIANHFFYLLSEGGQHHDSAYRSGSTVAGIGVSDAYDIWYEALTSYMTSSTNFAGARTATESACAALGHTTTTCDDVSTAWYEVGVGSAPTGGGGGGTGGGSGVDTSTPDTGTPDTSTPATGCPTGWTELTGTLTSGTDDQYTYSTSSTGTHNFQLSGPASADFDLYLYKKKGRSYSTVDSSTGTTSTETISSSNKSGSFLVQVISASGAGAYSLCYDLPS